jgi:hypothetical protein
MAKLTFLIRIQAIRDPLRGELPHVHVFVNDGQTRSHEMPSCSPIDLALIRRSSNFNSSIYLGLRNYQKNLVIQIFTPVEEFLNQYNISTKYDINRQNIL